MPRVVAAKCPWPDCKAEWTDHQRHTVLDEIKYFNFGGRGVKGDAHCPVCNRLIQVVANPNLPMIVTKGRPELRVMK